MAYQTICTSPAVTLEVRKSLRKTLIARPQSLLLHVPSLKIEPDVSNYTVWEGQGSSIIWTAGPSSAVDPLQPASSQPEYSTCA